MSSVEPSPRPRRSCLAVPGSSEKMLLKAISLPADQVFLDLEDSVAPALKNSETRRLVIDALHETGWHAATRVVRVNGINTPWFLDDVLEIVSGAGDVLDCVMVPKVESASQVHFVDQLLAHLERKCAFGRPIGLEIQIESPVGLMNIEQIAAASPRIETLIFGPGDYAASAGMRQLSVGEIRPDYPGDAWHYVLARIVTAARAFGLQAIDGPFAAIRDLHGFATVARRSCALGFDGKWALHPDQISVCNEIYAPSSEELERARRIRDAYETAQTEQKQGAAVFESEMIDEASMKMALSILARGDVVGPVGAAE